jgi:hypothetical protein
MENFSFLDLCFEIIEKINSGHNCRFLVDRASMLLFVVDKRDKKRLLSLQEAIALMVRGSVLHRNSNAVL